MTEYSTKIQSDYKLEMYKGLLIAFSKDDPNTGGIGVDIFKKYNGEWKHEDYFGTMYKRKSIVFSLAKQYIDRHFWEK